MFYLDERLGYFGQQSLLCADADQCRPVQTHSLSLICRFYVLVLLCVCSVLFCCVLVSVVWLVARAPSPPQTSLRDVLYISILYKYRYIDTIVYLQTKNAVRLLRQLRAYSRKSQHAPPTICIYKYRDSDSALIQHCSFFLNRTV